MLLDQTYYGHSGAIKPSASAFRYSGNPWLIPGKIRKIILLRRSPVLLEFLILFNLLSSFPDTHWKAFWNCDNFLYKHDVTASWLVHLHTCPAGPLFALRTSSVPLQVTWLVSWGLWSLNCRPGGDCPWITSYILACYMNTCIALGFRSPGNFPEELRITQKWGSWHTMGRTLNNRRWESINIFFSFPPSRLTKRKKKKKVNMYIQKTSHETE